MKAFGIALLVLLVALAAMGSWQLLRYQGFRADFLQDGQRLFYGAETLHIVVFVEAPVDGDLYGSLTSMRGVLEAGGGQLIYAGQAAFTLPSEQVSAAIGAADWDAVLLVQFEDRVAWERLPAAAWQGERDRFERTWVHGFDRPVLLNLLLPQALLGFKLAALGRSAPPLQPAATQTEYRAQNLPIVAARLRAMAEVNPRALMVFNISRSGSAEQQAADREYGMSMLARMGRDNHGPMHLGRPVRIEGGHDFNQIALVYYPGPEYFADLMESEFFTAIIGDKQLGDNQSVPTVPILDRI